MITKMNQAIYIIGYLRNLLFLCMILNFQLLHCQDIKKDYCVSDTFNVSCPKDKVILVTHALYGRMKASSSCIEGSGAMQCSVDMITQFDSKCSGQRSCSVKVRDFVDNYPCGKDFTSYLEASYRCIKGPTVGPRQCPRDHPGIPVQGTDGYVMYSAQDPTNCHWNIQVKDGQNVNLTLLPLGSTTNNHDCKFTISIVDGPKHKDFSLCSLIQHNPRQRLRYVYTSNSSQISVSVRGPDTRNSDRKFMLLSQAVGCANLPAPPNAWSVRQGPSTLMVKCNNTGETWYLTCSGHDWQGGGTIGNCATDEFPLSTTKRKQKSPFVHQGVIFAVLVGIVLGVAIGALLLFAVHCYKRRHKSNQRANFMMVPQESKEKYYEDYTASLDVKGQLKDSYPALLRDSEIYDTNTPRQENQQGGPKHCPTSVESHNVDSHNVHIKPYPHDKSLYHTVDRKCIECACPNNCNRCDVVPCSRYIDVE